jgi:LuxR family maltose regulon positive regulatory protein
VCQKLHYILYSGFQSKSAICYLNRNAPISLLRIIGLGEYISGYPGRALKFYLEGLALSETTGLLSFIRANILQLCDTYVEQGALHQAAESYCRMLIQAREMEDRADICHALLGLAQIAYEWNDLTTARQQVQEALPLSQQIIEAVFQVQAIIMQARVLHAQDETSAALEQLAAFLARFPALPLPASPMRSWLLQDLLTWQCQLQFAQGDLSAVQRWMGSREQDTETLPGLHRERGELLIARWLLAQGKADEALALLTPLPEAAQQSGRVRDALEIRVLIALSYAARKQMPEARALLLEILTHTHPEGYVRLFVDEGEAMASLLQTLLPYLHDKSLLTYVQNIL